MMIVRVTSCVYRDSKVRNVMVLLDCFASLVQGPQSSINCLIYSKDDLDVPVPGCNGIPRREADYCAKPENVLLPPPTSHALRLREPSCTPANPCMNPCEGGTYCKLVIINSRMSHSHGTLIAFTFSDCDGDSSCFGSMKCFMRGRFNPLAKVPHCVGDGIPEADYCYEPDESKLLSSPNTLQQRNILCSDERPCFQCQGDCDYDSHCYGRLKCFHRRM